MQLIRLWNCLGKAQLATLKFFFGVECESDEIRCKAFDTRTYLDFHERSTVKSLFARQMNTRNGSMAKRNT
jgi:hypothetical protein